MDIFTVRAVTKNGKIILICGMCRDGYKMQCVNLYKNGVKSAALPETLDEYFLDYSLMQLIVNISPKCVVAVGASIGVPNVVQRSGGIIGNPFSKVQSAEDEIEEIGHGLFEVAFAGKFGAVLKGNRLKAEKVKKEFEKLIFLNSRVGLKKAVGFLDKLTDEYIFVSDGSGEGGYPYICARKGEIKEELSD
ncbi:MAG: hypothetical protein PHY44_08730 [Lachnospiraceae bacterium]|nr:hypothetical protein [Lachnospiraceae bacterium]